MFTEITLVSANEVSLLANHTLQRRWRDQSRDRRDDNTWSSVVIQTILAGCAKRKRENVISDDAFVMTMSRKLHPTLMIAREYGCPASPTRRVEENDVVVVDDDRRCLRSGKPRMRRIGWSVTMSVYMREARAKRRSFRHAVRDPKIGSHPLDGQDRVFSKSTPRGPGIGRSIRRKMIGVKLFRIYIQIGWISLERYVM